MPSRLAAKANALVYGSRKKSLNLPRIHAILKVVIRSGTCFAGHKGKTWKIHTATSQARFREDSLNFSSFSPRIFQPNQEDSSRLVPLQVRGKLGHADSLLVNLDPFLSAGNHPPFMREVTFRAHRDFGQRNRGRSK